nr:hypothetical protein Iba_chr10fCG4620 [Ipomoea batatas]
MDRNTTLAPSPSPEQKGEPQQVTPPPPTESNTNKVRVKPDRNSRTQPLEGGVEIEASGKVALTPSPNHSSKDINSEVEILDGMPWGMARSDVQTLWGYPNPAMAAVAPVMVIEGAVGVAEAGVEKAANSIGLANRARANSSKLGAIEGIMVELVVAGVAIAMPGGSVLVAVSSGLHGVAMGLVRSYTGVLGLLLGAMVSMPVELAHGEGKERERDVTGVKGVRVVWLFGEVTGVEGVKGSLVVW